MYPEPYMHKILQNQKISSTNITAGDCTIATAYLGGGGGVLKKILSRYVLPRFIICWVSGTDFLAWNCGLNNEFSL